MAESKARVFWDADALIAGANSPTGGAGALILRTEQGELGGVVSAYVLAECRRNLTAKLPKALPAFERIIATGALEVVEAPARADLEGYHQYADAKDVPNVVAAHRSGATYLLTFNLKDYRREAIQRELGIEVLPPGELIGKLQTPPPEAEKPDEKDELEG